MSKSKFLTQGEFEEWVLCTFTPFRVQWILATVFHNIGATTVSVVGDKEVKIVQSILTTALGTAPIRKEMSAFPSRKTLAADPYSVRSSQTHFHVGFTKCLSSSKCSFTLPWGFRSVLKYGSHAASFSAHLCMLWQNFNCDSEVVSRGNSMQLCSQREERCPDCLLPVVGVYSKVDNLWRKK